MKYLFMELYSDFQCVGGACPDTCCRGWKISVDEVSMRKYGELEEPLRSKILANMGEEDGQKVIKLDSERNCPFLNEQGLCAMYELISPDALCNTCQVYPRKIVDYYDVTLLTVALSCPEVARMLLDHPDVIRFQYTEDDIPSNTAGADWLLYNELINSLVVTMEILQERGGPLWKRLHMVLDVSGIVQQYIDECRLTQLREAIAVYKDAEWRKCQYIQMESEEYTISNLGIFLNELFHTVEVLGREMYVMKSFDRVNLPSDETELCRWMEDFRNEGRDETEYEKIATQLSFEYYMNALKGVSLDVHIIKILIYLVLLQTQEMYIMKQGDLTKQDRIRLISKLSRVLEHSNVLDFIVENMLKANPRKNMYGLLSILK